MCRTYHVYCLIIGPNNMAALVRKSAPGVFAHEFPGGECQEHNITNPRTLKNIVRDTTGLRIERAQRVALVATHRQKAVLYTASTPSFAGLKRTHRANARIELIPVDDLVTQRTLTPIHKQLLAGAVRKSMAA